MKPYKKASVQLSDKNVLYYWAHNEMVCVHFMSPVSDITFTKDDLYVMIKEIEEWEKKNATAVC